MKLSASSYALALAASSHTATADFDIYRIRCVQNSQTDYGYKLFGGVPSCEDVRVAPWIEAKSDLIGNQLDVRCVGSGCSDPNVTCF